jgi:hypothetical protein
MTGQWQEEQEQEQQEKQDLAKYLDDDIAQTCSLYLNEFRNLQKSPIN